MPLDIIATPLYQYDNTSVRDKLYFVRLIDLRYQLLAAEKFLEDSTDAYITTRESYLQNRNYAIHDGDVPEDDEFFDEFFDEE
jgi:phospholipid-binding lipoprotein MlaA